MKQRSKAENLLQKNINQNVIEKHQPRPTNMKKYFSHSFLYAALLSASQYGGFCAEEHSTTPMGREDAILVTVSASVEDIDYKNREVTLKGPLGNEVTLVADPRIKRFDEIKVGDSVRADYYVSVAAELRKPTKEEMEHPITYLDASGKAPPGTAPAAGGLRRFKVVTTIEGLDRPTQTVTVKGPRGHYLTARVADPSRLTKAHIGDNVVITYTEAVAISLDKAEKKGSD